MSSILSVREIEEKDISPITKYWLTSEPRFLTAMGVDLSKIPSEQEWENLLSEQINTPLEKKKSYCIIWEENEKSIGHCNVNKIIFGHEAYLHLHLWNAEKRKKGTGTHLVKMTLPYFFEKFKLRKLYSEPYALNPAPNKTLLKAGFEFVKKQLTTPGWINFEQEINLWEMSLERFKLLK